MARSPRSKRTVPRPNAWVSLLATMKLARWQLRQTRSLLLVAGIGIVVAVILICTIPLYAQVAISAGIRDALNATPEGPYINVNSISGQLSAQPINSIQQQLNQEFQGDMGPLINTSPQLSISVPHLNLLTLPPVMKKRGAYINFIGESINNASSHLQLLQGRLPTDTSNGNSLEVAMLPQTAQALGLKVGSTITIQAFAGNIPQKQQNLRNITAHVVGIFKLPANDPYWHQEDFQIAQPPGLPPPPGTFKVLASNNAIINVFNLGSGNSARTQLFLNGSLTYVAQPELNWYYSINVTKVNITNLSTLVSGMSTALTRTSNQPVDSPYVEQTQANGPLTSLQTYSNYVFVLLIPATGLTALLMGLVLYFVSVMTDLLVDRKSESVAVLRSRGANRGQIFNLFVLQAFGLGIVALIVGPLLAIVAVRLLVFTTLSPSDQNAINLLTNEPGQVAITLLEYALVAVVIALIAMIFSIYRATRTDIVSMRRESARTTRVPFWQRTGLDVIAAFIALVGYGVSIYITNPNVLSTRLRALLLSPMTLLGAVFLLIAATLLFLRGFPLFLRFCSWIASRSRGASPILALAQMARAPAQSVRTTMLLAFATAFIIFALVFSASQAQRVRDVAAYQVGSDFSGDISEASANVPSSTFAKMPGVLSATTGYESSEEVSGVPNASVELRAVDVNTYAKTMIWNSQDSTQSISSLMQQLSAASKTANGSVPAIVDAAGWQTMHLAIGSHFSMSDLNGQLDFVAIAEVQHIPTVNDTTEVNDTNDYIPAGGVLVDFQTYYNTSLEVNSNPIITSYVWVKSKSDPASIAKVRNELPSINSPMPVNSLNDRRAIITSLQHDPLYVALLEMLIAGAVAALLLALIGNLIASWQNARNRLTSFSVLRALGSSQQQIASVLLWEQSIVYATSLILGLLFGVLLSLLALPSLIFTSAGSSVTISTGEFYVIQSVPPISVVIPITLWIALAVLIIICIVAIWMMVRIVSRPSISQTLRLNED
jgi:ABC-type lipoprotein release transport system permease subunit